MASHDDQLVYEDLTSNKIRTNDRKVGTININGISKLDLLSTDGDNNIFLGNNINDKTNRIYYGKLSTNTSNWQHVNLKSEIDPKKIIIMLNGDIYLKNQDGYLVNAKSDSKSKYNGQLIGVYDNTIVSVENNNLEYLLSPYPSLYLFYIYCFFRQIFQL